METARKVNEKKRRPAVRVRRGGAAFSAPASRGPSLVTRLLLFLAAFPLVPAAAGTVRALRLSSLLRDRADPSFLGLPAATGAFVCGALAFAAAFVLRRVPAVSYVAVHEATHALFGLLFGARVSHLRLWSDAGAVDVSRRNAVILLAPYFFPLPFVAALLLTGAVSLFVPLVGTAAGTFLSGLAGAAWGFHFCFTVNALLQYQTDLDAYGFFFSSALLAFLNLAVLWAALVALTPVTLAGAWSDWLLCQRDSFLWFLDVFHS